MRYHWGKTEQVTITRKITHWAPYGSQLITYSNRVYVVLVTFKRLNTVSIPDIPQLKENKEYIHGRTIMMTPIKPTDKNCSLIMATFTIILLP